MYVAGQQVEKRFGAPFSRVHYGLADRLERKGSVPDPYAVMRANASLFEQLRYPAKSYPATSWESVIARDYGEAALSVAFALAGGGAARVPEAEKMYRKAILLAPTEAVAYKNLGTPPVPARRRRVGGRLAVEQVPRARSDRSPDVRRIRAALARLKGTR